MLEAIIEIGDKILLEQDIVKSSILKVNTVYKGKPKNIVFMNFDTKNKKVNFKINEMDEDTVFEYLHLKRQGGPNSNQWYVTFTNTASITSEVLSQLLTKDITVEVKEKIEFILNAFYHDFGENVTPKYRYMLDLNIIGIIDGNLEEMFNKEKDNAKPYKAVQEQVQKAIKKHFEKSFGVRKEEIGLYSLSIDNEPIASTSWYRELINKSLSEETHKNEKSAILQCSYCGSTNDATSEINFAIKYYTTNQVIFANNFNKKNYNKNMVLCKSCKDKLLAGETFILNQMKGNISKLNIYIIPHIIHSDYEFTKEHLYNLSQKLKQTINVSNNITSLSEYRSLLLDLNSVGEGSHFLINLMFYKKMNQSTKILKLLKDIDPSIFEKIGEATNKAFSFYSNYYSEGILKRENFQKGLNLVYYMTPVRLSQSKPSQYQNILSIYEALFYERKLKKRETIANIIKTLEVNWFEQDGYNVSNDKGKDYIDFTIVDALFYMKFLEYMGIIEGGDSMDTTILSVKDSYKNFIEDMKYDELQASLFLLGCLVGAVGRSQNKRNYDMNKSGGTYKPILNKLNFNGMDFSKVKRLSNEILNKLRQEDILKYNEAIYSSHKALLGLNEKSWKYNKDENLYYILSGYAYETMKKREEKENE